MELHKRRSLLSPVAGASFYSAVGAASADISTALVVGQIYKFTTSTACMIIQSSVSDNATVGAGSMLVNPGDEVLIEGQQGTTLAVIRVAADGHCTLQRMRFLNSEG